MRKWYPVKIKEIGDQKISEWAYFENQNFTDPFFEESWSKAKSHPYQSSGYFPSTDLSFFSDLPNDITFVEPSAIIFHCSRCGSTLLSQLLSINNTHISLSEVPIFDQILRDTLFKPEEEKAKALKILKNVIKWYGQTKADSHKQKLFIKVDSWHFYFWKAYRQMFPNVPFFIVYRNPLEIFASQKKLKGMHAVQGILEPKLFNLTKAQTTLMKQEEYLSNVLAYYYQSILAITEKEPNTLLLNYAQGGYNLINSFYKHLNLTMSKDEALNFEDRCKYHSKDIHHVFKEKLDLESPSKILEKSLQLYHQIEEVRLNRS